MRGYCSSQPHVPKSGQNNARLVDRQRPRKDHLLFRQNTMLQLVDHGCLARTHGAGHCDQPPGHDSLKDVATDLLDAGRFKITSTRPVLLDPVLPHDPGAQHALFPRAFLEPLVDGGLNVFLFQGALHQGTDKVQIRFAQFPKGATQ